MNMLRSLILKNLKKRQLKTGRSMMEYNAAKEFRQRKISVLHFFKNVVLIIIGVFSAAFGLKGFLLPNSFIDGGVTGISMLTSELTKIPLPLLLVIINAPFMILGYKQIGRSFAIHSILAICALAFVLSIVNFPVITDDKLLVAIFGGFFLGGGIGFAVRGGAVLDGTEILAIFLTKKTGLTMGDIILLFNIFIFTVAAYLLTIETALYSILTYMSAARTIDFIIEGVEEYIGVTIVSSHHEEIRLMVTESMGRGVTIYTGKRGFGKHGDNRKEVDIIFTVVTRLEITRLQNEVEKIDSNAFIVMHSVKDTRGGMIKKRPMSH